MPGIEFGTPGYKEYTTAAPLDDLKWEHLEDRRRIDSMLYRLQFGLVYIRTDRYMRVSDSHTKGQS